ncbi:NnrS family protein [Arhodomonas sp. AD133]|uniref:NnrS family protein n=1 Tax=Arhodomonas sp. AD133 TaxID=3415009 RepID=UPI003EB6E6D4
MPHSHLLAYPFRVFFMLASLFAGGVVLAWLAMLTGRIPMPADLSPLWWHAHEMIYGFVPAAIAGFLLTAMANWTGLAPPRGWALLALAALWLAGRLAFALTAWLPAIAVTIVDLAFLPVLAAVAWRTLRRAGNRRNLPLVAVLLVFASGNALMHAALLGASPAFARVGELMGLDLTALLIAVIGGRITPAFTTNWLARHGGDPARVRKSTNVDRSALLALVALIVVDLIARGSAVAGVIALIAAGLHALRLWGWRGWHTLSDPLLWILHLGYAWLVLALLLRGLAAFTTDIGASVWIHALGVGAIGVMIIGVMTRVAVAHTGHGLILRRGATLIYAAVNLAAVLRVVSAMGGGTLALQLAAAAWAAAFVGFVFAYGPVLNRPRADGQPG